MIVTAERIQALAPHAYFTIAMALAQALEAEMPGYGVDTALRAAHFMGQGCWESGYFARFEEDLNYSSVRIAEVWPRLAGRAAALAYKPQALGNAAYADRDGNGDENSGDGWRYRGRGIFQLTGRANYAAAGSGLELDLTNKPDQVATPDGSVRSALWFWKMRGCNEAADQDDAEAVTRLINGPARDGLTQRRQLTEQAKAIFV